MSIRINLDNPSATYFPGQTITGTAIVDLHKPKKIRRVHLDFEGEEHCSWTKSETRTHNGKTEHYSVRYHNSRHLFQYRLVLVEGSSEFKLPAGMNTYRFDYTLPFHLPGNWEGSHGYIRYYVKGCVNIPWKFDYTSTAVFKVVPIVDLNRTPLAQQRIIIEEQKTVGALCCASGNITLTVTAPKHGYVCDELIPFIVEIENHSGSKIYETIVEIIKIVEYTARYPSYEKETDYSVLVSGKWSTNLAPRTGKHTFDAFLRLKLTEPTTLDDNSIVKIFYRAQVKCKISGMHLNLIGKVPIIVGTVQTHLIGENMDQIPPVPKMIPLPVEPVSPPPPYETLPSAPMNDPGWNPVDKK